MKKNLLILILGTATVMLFFSAGKITVPNTADTPQSDITLPAFILKNQDDQIITAHSLQDHWSLLYFGYTHCKPDCIETIKLMDQAAQIAKSDFGEDTVKPLLISIDPERDNSTRLQDFLQQQILSLDAATGDVGDLLKLAKQLGIIYNRETHSQYDDRNKTSDYHFDHSLQILLFDPNGKLAHRFPPPAQLDDIIQPLVQHIQDFNTMTEKKNSLMEKLASSSLYILPHHLITQAVHALSHIETTWVKNLLIRGYTSIFSLNMDEAVESQPTAYSSLNALFTRALKPNARPVFSTGNSLHASADGVLSEFGNVELGKLIQAKGFYYDAEKLLGDKLLAAPFLSGQYHTIYLSPKDYHRVHMPITGILTDMVYIPGRLFSVSPMTTRHIPEIFTRNERVVAFFDTDHGRMAVVMVGAINVAAIETVWAGLVTPPSGKAITQQHYADGQVYKAGAEMGRFNMGSTVVVLTEKGFGWLDELEKGKAVKMGETLANRN